MAVAEREPLGPGSLSLADRLVVVTGAARGIGAATAALCARLGARLALCDRDPLGGAPEGAITAVLDVRDDDAARAFAARLGRVDVLVNNAGGTFPADFAALSPRAEAALIAENFTQVTAMTRLLLPRMPQGASIVNVTSIEAHQAAPGFAIYAAMKAALENLTRTLALELAPRGVRVNAVAPDAIPTEGEESVREAMLAASPAYDPARVPPLGRLGVPEDAAAAIAYLASDLSRFVTGTTIHVDGGAHAAGGWRRVRT
ncbi:SDR family NAD(P)-dependent oxidoreductase [Bailinhaonella thermotolerans]|uniref:SDR family NAD(P)-dependent oxidoreductase n=1 Tax=Bailinhaonella thermotolerans TaxID=1070861 RepID=UPI001F5BF4B1|nr:SDR family oxidoreductase [Bailinhaonella thermotolerans]